MLGFTPLSAAALSATGKTEALVVLVAASFTSSAGILTGTGEASKLFNSTVLSTIAAPLAFDAKASLEIATTIATITAKDLADITGKASTVPTGASATGSGGQLGFEAIANFTIPEAATSTVVNANFADVDAQATISLTGASFGTTTGGVDDVTGQASIVPTGTSITGSSGQLGFDAKAFFDLTGALSSFTAADVTLDAKATVATTGAQSSTDAGSVTTTGRARVRPPSATASGFSGDLGFDAKAKHEIVGAFVSTGTNLLDFSALASTTITTADAALDLTLVDVGIVAGSRADILNTPRLTVVSGNITAEGVRFNFEQFADSYDTSRVIYILGTPEDNTVYVTQENATVVTHNTDRKHQVEATAIHNVVYIHPDKTNRTVYITR